MSRKQPYLFISMMVLFAAIACRASGDLVATPTTELTQLATSTPSVILSVPTVNVSTDMRTMFPSFYLTDPNAVCVGHHYYAFSCVDASGWHIYKNEYNEVSHPIFTFPHEVFGCPDGRIYLVGDTIYRVEGETLIDIGGYVDMGTLVCGSGNEIWVSDYREVKRFDGSAWTSYPVEEYFKGRDNEIPNSIHSLGIAPNGNVWVTTDSVIATFDGTEWKEIEHPDNYHFMESFAQRQGLVIDSSGAVWVVAYPETCCVDGQLLRFDGVEWSAFPSPDDAYHEIQMIAVDSKNRIWAATEGEKIFTLNPETKGWDFQFDIQQIGLGNGDTFAISGMNFDGQGRLWVSANNGLGVFNGTTWTIYHSDMANLFMNDITKLRIIGNGPALPALEARTPSGCMASSGTWSAQSGGTLSIIFTIQDCKITTVFIMGLIKEQWVTVSNEANGPIVGSEFNLLQEFSDQDRYALSGSFSSPRSASIQLVIFKGFRFTTDQPSPLDEDLIINAAAILEKK